MTDLDERSINVIRGLAMDAVQRANSGHPGTPMALAPLAHVLFTRVMRYDAGAPDWFDRDRFVLSNGHASMLLYALLYLTGFGLDLDDLRLFRQWGSRTPGHPEYRAAPGIEVTTGPLGQGFANSVGITLAEANLRARYGPEVCDHRVFVIASDGDFEEGISHESASLAGHLGLGRLVCVYDDNHISIDGPTELAYSDDVARRFEAYGWHVVRLGEAANDVDALERGLRDAMTEPEKPSLVILRSHIGWPSPKYTDTAHAHGSPLGEDEVRVVKDILGLPPDETFWVPDDVLAAYREAGRRGRPDREAWEARHLALRTREPELAEEFDACLEQRGLPGWEAKLPSFTAGDSIATRAASKQVLDAIVDVVPGIVCGGADLSGNTGTELANEAIVATHQFGGRQLRFGIREFGMGGVLNGMSVSGLLPAGGTFFVFSDYMRAAARLAALSGYRTAFVWTHDSVGLGEDGPTHQPIEQLAAFRAMPDMRMIRPADANEVAQAWQVHVDSDRGPTALILTRQKVPVLDGTAERAPDGVARGAYTLVDEDSGRCDLVLVGTGSEVAVCVAAREQLRADGLSVRVVSMPSWDLFGAQSDAYRADVLPPPVPKLAVEAAATFGWDRWVDDVVGIDRFGGSAPGATALAELGINPDHVVARAHALLDRTAGGSR
ncbi:MAG TPA: transketolase [Acidimicrobiia bacterium]|nr:transketolase [Acidimicrobiia bacterium]HEV3450505.1 transketolase [Acidimicrobiia bacterium]